ncbi:MAG: cyclase family protein [Anaerolineaceae bacterium]|nr:cyclase family protein [Anaerolineaceae bacterium]
MPSLSYARVVELSHPIHPGIPRWPGDPPVSFTQAANRDEDGYFLRSFSMGEHAATHLNAPLSFFAGAAGVDTIPPEALICPAVVIDAREEAAANPDFALSVEHVQAWEARHGRIAAGSLALLCTGWGSLWGDPARFLGLDSAGQAHFPGFGVDAARFLLEERQVSGLGSDTHGIEPGWDSQFQVNRLTLAAGALVLENLAHLEQLPPVGVVLIVGVLRLVGGSGSPAVVLALIS